MSVRGPGMREPRGGHDMMIQPRGHGLCSLLNCVVFRVLGVNGIRSSFGVVGQGSIGSALGIVESGATVGLTGVGALTRH